MARFDATEVRKRFGYEEVIINKSNKIWCISDSQMEFEVLVDDDKIPTFET